MLIENHPAWHSTMALKPSRPLLSGWINEWTFCHSSDVLQGVMDWWWWHSRIEFQLYAEKCSLSDDNLNSIFHIQFSTIIQRWRKFNGTLLHSGWAARSRREKNRWKLNFISILNCVQLTSSGPAALNSLHILSFFQHFFRHVISEEWNVVKQVTGRWKKTIQAV